MLSAALQQRGASLRRLAAASSGLLSGTADSRSLRQALQASAVAEGSPAGAQPPQRRTMTATPKAPPSIMRLADTFPVTAESVLLVESSAKARKIQEFLGAEFKVTYGCRAMSMW